MKLLVKTLSIGACLSFSYVQAATIDYVSLAGTVVTDTYNAAGGYAPDGATPAYDVDTGPASSSTYNHYTPLGGVRADTHDGTFSLNVDLNSGASSLRHVIWETGGSTDSTTLAFTPNTGLIELMTIASSGFQVLTTYNLSIDELTGGDIEFVWSWNLNGDLPTDFRSLFVNGSLVESVAFSAGSWSGGDGSGYGGSTAGQFNSFFPDVGAGGAATTNFSGAGFGAINNVIGLSYYNDIFVGAEDFTAGEGSEAVPVPSALLLMGMGLAGLGFSRRSMK